jgi:anti-sigma factor RsiW
MSDELSCREFVDLVTDYVEGALAPRDRREFEAHLAVCGGCDAYLDGMRRTIELTGRLTEADVAPEIERELLAAFRGWQRA